MLSHSSTSRFLRKTSSLNGLVLLGKSEPETHRFLPSNMTGYLNRKPIGFYHQIDRAFRLKFSHHPILWESDSSTFWMSMSIEKQDSSGPGWLIKPKNCVWPRYGWSFKTSLYRHIPADQTTSSMKPSQLGPYSHCIQMAVGENSQNYQQLEMDGFKSKWPFFCESKQVPKPTNGHCLDLDEPEKIHQR